MHWRFVLVQINDEVFKEKKIKCPKSVFGVVVTNTVIRRGMDLNIFWMLACGREFHIACMRSLISSFEIEKAENKLDAKQPNPTRVQ